MVPRLFPALFLFLATPHPGSAQVTSSTLSPAPATSPSAKLEPYWVLLEPTVMRSKTSFAVPGARDSVFTPVEQTRDAEGFRIYSEDAFKLLGFGPGTFLKRAGEAAERALASVTPKFVADPDGKVAYAILESSSRMASGLVAAPGFAKKFSDKLGTSLLVVAPEQTKVYVFPRATKLLAAMGPELRAAFDESTIPGSAEVFAFEADDPGVKVVGTLEK